MMDTLNTKSFYFMSNAKWYDFDADTFTYTLTDEGKADAAVVKSFEEYEAWLATQSDDEDN
jgi:hypothetical protein